MVEKAKKNIKQIWKTGLQLSGSIFTFLTIILSFLPWDNMGIHQTCAKVLILLGVIILSFLLAAIYILLIKRSVIIWEEGDNKIMVCYGDIIKISFPGRKCEKRIVVIPVNTCFDTIVDECPAKVQKPLVSLKTVHGMWIKGMERRGCDRQKLDENIEFRLKDQRPTAVLDQRKKDRGKRNSYSKGTIVPIEGKNGVTYFLLALSEFDENNNAHCSKEDIVECIKSILSYADMHGQGYDLYISLMGTGMSRAGLTHKESLMIMKSVLLLYCEKIRGSCKIVIEDKAKVSIFD